MLCTVLIMIALGVTLALCWILDLAYAFAAIMPWIHDALVAVGVFISFQ
jgi:preprotein translocase subunit SecF